MKTNSLSTKALIFIILTTFSVVHSQNISNIFYSGDINGFNGEPMVFSLNRWQVTLQAPANASSSNFLFRDSNSNFVSKWSRGIDINLGAIETAFWQGGDTSINVEIGKYYTFNLSNVNYNINGELIVQETDNPPVAFITSNAVTPVTPTVYPGQDLEITVTLLGNKSPQEKVFVRYTTDSFTSSDVVEVPITGSAGSATIPAAVNTAGANVIFYVYTTTVAATSTSNHDLITLNIENNGGSNYSYTVESSWTTSGNGTNWSDPNSWDANAVPPNGVPVTIANDLVLDTSPTVSEITISNGITLTSELSGSRLLSIDNGGTLDNDGTFTANDGSVEFLGNGSVSGSTTFNNVSISGGVDFGSGSIIQNILTINDGGYLSQTAGGTGIIDEADIPTYSSGAKLSFTGDFTVNDLASGWGTSTKIPPTVEVLNGGDLELNVDRTTTDLNVSASSSFIINNSITLDLDSSSVLDLGGNIVNDGTIIFRSGASGSAQLDEFTGTISGSGNITVERYMSANRAFRFVTSSVTSSASIRDTWQQGGLNPTDAGFQANVGTHITGAGGAANGFDTTPSNSPSLFTYDNATGAYTAVSNTTSNTLTAGQAYALFIRGDRTIDLNSNTSTATETTLSASGSLLQGPQATNGPNLQALSTSPESFSLVANPYQAIVDFNALSFSGGVNSNFLYVFDPSAPNFGNFIVLENSQDASDMFIRPGQSFFVVNQTTVTTPSITFNEDDKATSGAPGTTVFSDNTLALANLEMYNSSNERVDVLKLRFQDNASNGIDNFDALKLENNGENLAALVNAKSYAIERRDTPQQNDVVVLSVDNYLDTQYLFKLVTENWDEAINVYVVDNYLNTSTLIQATQDFSFTVDANIPESIAEDRFSLVFENTTLGTTDNTFGNSFSLYPNPTKDGLFSLRTPGLTGEVDVQISNVLGQEVKTQTLSVIGNEVNVNAQDLASGVYLVKLSQNNHSFTSKVIIE